MSKGKNVALLLVAVLAASALIPASHASNITLVLNPSANEATMNAYINSSLSISTNSSSALGQILVKDIASTQTGGNLTIGQSTQSRGSIAFEIMNNSISRMDASAHLDSLAMSYQRTVDNVTSGSLVTFYSNTSLKIGIVVKGIFNNNSANLSWRSFSTNQTVPLNGIDVNQVNFNNTIMSGTGPVNTVNMSVFAKSLLQWNRSYDPGTNVTTFSLNAGKTVDINYSPGGAAGFNLTYILDPSFSISAPGYDTASADSITVGNPPASNPAIYYGMGAVFIAVVLVPMLLRRRRLK